MEQINQRAKLLQKYLSDEMKELQALYALQALMVQMEQPASELFLLVFCLYSSVTSSQIFLLTPNFYNGRLQGFLASGWLFKPLLSVAD